MPTENDPILQHLVEALRICADFNRDDRVPPVCILWPDKDRQWSVAIDAVRQACAARNLGPVLEFGAYAPELFRGPAIWLRTVLSAELQGKDWLQQGIPLIYLPGIEMADLKSAEDIHPLHTPLLELMLRGATFTQPKRNDWTVQAFLHEKTRGLGLDLVLSSKTLDATQRALEAILRKPLKDFRGKQWTSGDFDKLLVADLPSMMLRWLNDGDAAEERMGTAQWTAFCDRVQEELHFSPQNDGLLSAAEQLAREYRGKWKQIWARFAEAPGRYPNIPDRLEGVVPANVKQELDTPYPSVARALEARLRATLDGCAGLPAHAAAKMLQELEESEKALRNSVWAQLGHTPLAMALGDLAQMAAASGKPLTGKAADELAADYVLRGWQVDAAAMAAMGKVRNADDVAAVQAALRAIYLPWLEKHAERLQAQIASAPESKDLIANAIDLHDGCCLLFADGLRYDVAQLLAERLKSSALTVQTSWRWAALPTVTATCKPAVMPVVAELHGEGATVDFTPMLRGKKKPATTDELRKLLLEKDIQILSGSDTGKPGGRAFTEAGALDEMGHEQEAKLAWRIDEEVTGLANRVRGLLDAGWRQVKIVTDHGWLLMPGGLPKVELHKSMTATKWGRSAILHDGAIAVGVPVANWSWSPHVRIAIARGVGIFYDGKSYSHGGWSLQEAVIPVLDVRGSATTTSAQITQARWTKQRCTVEVSGAPDGATVDLRLLPGDAASSRATQKLLVDGLAKLLAERDEDVSKPAFVVVLAKNGSVIAQRATKIGA